MLTVVVPAAAMAADEGAEPIPAEKIEKLAELTKVPRGKVSAEKLLEVYQRRLYDAMRLSARLEREYPDAPNLYKVQRLMMAIAEVLGTEFEDPDAAKQRLVVARRLANSEAAPIEARYQADVVVVSDATASMVPKDLRKALLQFVGRYIGTGQEVPAKLYALMLAGDGGAEDLFGNLARNLEANHLDETDVRAVLRAMGRHPDVGKVFQAELTTLEGEKIKLPQDTRGKVVVLDFWGTWVPDAPAFARQVRKIHKAYGDKGVRVIGISLDEKSDLEKVKAFIKKYNLDWTHTFSGKYALDPTALEYGLFGREMEVVNPIPNRWVIGRDGKVISDAATDTRKDPGRLERLVQKALAQPESGKSGAGSPEAGEE
jgi:thiol-disulfide isomerase/thioredoxin